MNTAVVDDLGFDHRLARGFVDFGNGIAQQVVAYMSQVQGFVGVGRRIFHHQLAGLGVGMEESEVFLLVMPADKTGKIAIGQNDI